MKSLYRRLPLCLLPTAFCLLPTFPLPRLCTPLTRGDVIISGRAFRDSRRKERVLFSYARRDQRQAAFLMDGEKVEKQ